MLAVRLPEAFKIDYLDLPIPEISDDEVLLKNINLGVCASDVQIYHGKHRYMKFPLIMGHEVSSEVAKVGKNVGGFKPGDRVVLQPQLVCGHCYPCEMGRFNVCEELKFIGVHTDGCACEYFAAKPRNLHKVPDNLPFDVAALVEPTAVGIASVKRSRDYKDANIVVMGAGTVGNLTAQAAKALGAEKVMITDIVDTKLRIAEECGIDYPVNTSKCSLEEAICDAFGSKRKADIIIDCAATHSTFATALSCARNGSTIVITGNFKEPVEFNVPAMQRREISLVGHKEYVNADFQEAISLLSSGGIVYKSLVSRHYPLNRYHESFPFIDSNPDKSMKVMIDIG